MKQWPATQWISQANELIALSKYCLNSHIDCFGIKGSYAGAFGIVQFMPSSLLAYGVDGNHDGVVDLSTPADAIPSAANFIKSHGWQQDQLLALTHYYGSSIGYPSIVLAYASLLGN
jgi:membrane-bound lytic murein transglycosylase B